MVGAQGVKIAAKELEKAIAGLNLLVAQKPDEVDVLKWVNIDAIFLLILYFFMLSLSSQYITLLKKK